MVDGGGANAGAESRANERQAVPPHLRSFEEAYRRNPRQAAQSWFEQARFGLFLHWGLYSYYGENCTYIYHRNVPIPEYKRTMERFTAERFDADFITDLALEAGMKYVTFVSRHHDGFSLWRTGRSDFHAGNSPAGRDFVDELATQCRAKGIGLFLYYSYALDWTHPWFPTEESGIVRAPKRVEGYHMWRDRDGNERYMEFVHGQLRELLTSYGPIAGIWFDPISSYYQRPDLFPLEETYQLIRGLQPHCLISFKNGGTGTEDFISPETRVHDGALKWLERGRAPKVFVDRVRANWQALLRGPKEFCSRLEDKGWGFVKDTARADADEVMRRLAVASAQQANLLLNTGPLFDGSIHPDAVATLREVGRRLRANGWPSGAAPGDATDEDVLTME